MTADAEGACFVDTNVLVYALAGDDLQRSGTAQDLLRRLMAAGTLRTSTQVLQEAYVVLTRKIRTRLSPQQALRYLDHIAAWPVATLDYAAVRKAIELSSSSQLSLWDALVIVAAVQSGAVKLYTEDLQDGCRLLGVEVVNPFHPAAA